MKQTVLALVAAIAAVVIATPAAAQEAAGDWVGVVEVERGDHLPLLVHIKRDDSGVLRGTMDSPAQDAHGLPIAEIAARGARLTFAVPSIGGNYAGEWVATVKAWRGEWSQKGMHWPLELSVAPPPLQVDWQMPPDIEIAKLIADRNAPRPGQGIVIGVLGPDGQRFVAGGTGAGARVDRSTLFEIGSISKVFTALILADMANKGEVSLDDPAAKYLPAGHHMPARGGRQITLRDLSTHRSGLPRMADDMGRVDSLDGPFVDYSEAKLLAFIDRYQLTRDIGSKWQYSNLGVGLLGYLLARAAHMDYETLLRKRITVPLGMKDTLITLPPRQAARLAAPFDAYMRPAKPWNTGLFAGAGGIRSSAADMLIFAKAVVDPKSAIAAAVRTTLSVRLPGVAPPSVDQALGWEVMHLPRDRELLAHGGQSGGFQSDLLLEPARGMAVVALTNSQAQPAPDDIALHILIGTPVEHTPRVPPAPLSLYKLALLLALSIGLAIYLGSQVKKPDRFAGRFFAWLMNGSHASLTDWAFTYLEIPKGAVALDVGCGGGRTIQKLAVKAEQVSGVDYAVGSVAASRSHNKALIAEGLVFVEQASVSHLPFPDDRFDIVTAIETQYYWPDLPGDMKEILRVLKPCGRLMIVAESYKGARNDVVLGPVMKLLGSSRLSVNDHRALFRSAGYEDVEIHEERRRGWLCAIGRKPKSS